MVLAQRVERSTSGLRRRRCVTYPRVAALAATLGTPGERDTQCAVRYPDCAPTRSPRCVVGRNPFRVGRCAGKRPRVAAGAATLGYVAQRLRRTEPLLRGWAQSGKLQVASCKLIGSLVVTCTLFLAPRIYLVEYLRNSRVNARLSIESMRSRYTLPARWSHSCCTTRAWKSSAT